MDTNFKMNVQNVNGAMHVEVSGHLDGLRVLDIMHFVSRHAAERQPIVIEYHNSSSASTSDFEILKGALQSLSDLGHPIVYRAPFRFS